MVDPKDLTITNSQGTGNSILNEFAATVDLTVHGNEFAEVNAAGLGLDPDVGYSTFPATASS